jgi:hypothetical protein
MIKAGDLENRMGAAPRGADAVNDAIRTMKAKPDAASELAQLRERVEHARGLLAPRGSCCGHCFGNGVGAALRIIDGIA